MSARNPYEDGPSVEPESCDLGGCNEPWAAEVERRNGPRKLRLCEAHHDCWTAAERGLEAEREELRGRIVGPLPISSLFSLARALDGHVTNGRKAG